LFYEKPNNAAMKTITITTGQERLGSTRPQVPPVPFDRNQFGSVPRRDEHDETGEQAAVEHRPCGSRAFARRWLVAL
jgi:hypothetical protein